MENKWIGESNHSPSLINYCSVCMTKSDPWVKQ